MAISPPVMTRLVVLTVDTFRDGHRIRPTRGHTGKQLRFKPLFTKAASIFLGPISHACSLAIAIILDIASRDGIEFHFPDPLTTHTARREAEALLILARSSGDAEAVRELIHIPPQLKCFCALTQN
jgi:hypothetical protein